MLVYSFKILDGEEIFIKNSLILYMLDTLKWINTLDKFRIKKNKGLYYHGSTYFEKNSIRKLKEIIFCWKNLFSEAAENFEIKVLINQNKKGYCTENYSKKEVVESLEKLIDLCNSAEKENNVIKCKKITIKLDNLK
ncbi:coproporphyrinogen III oxidase [Fusobacterium animalis]|uniref:coproporphyrinogen III oxidase n=1 Tax=Fusobacterium animalis TaxID=76859 RepID=UPI0035583E7E